MGIFRWHDRLTSVSFSAAMLALAIIALSFCYEVVARYFFNAPTIWANPVSSYALCASIFLAAPELTRLSAHISLNLLENFLSDEANLVLQRALRLICSLACLGGAWITGRAAISDFEMGILTNTYLEIPKWWLSSLIPYGLFSSAVYFARQSFNLESSVSSGGITA